MHSQSKTSTLALLVATVDPFPAPLLCTLAVLTSEPFQSADPSCGPCACPTQV